MLSQVSLAEKHILIAYDDYDYRKIIFPLLMKILDSQNKFKLMIHCFKQYCEKFANLYNILQNSDLDVDNIKTQIIWNKLMKIWRFNKMQSNANRIRTILKHTKLLLSISAFLIIILSIKDIDWASSLISFIWIVFSIAWWAFDNFLWKGKWINKGLKLNKSLYCPKIGGRWEGTLKRDGKEHKFVIEIKQTYTNISCVTYSTHGHSKSLCAELLYDQQNDSHSFVFLWEGKTSKNPKGQDEPSNYFTGTTILIISDDCNSLTGSYFTDRSPKQTKGTLILNARQDVLKNAF